MGGKAVIQKPLSDYDNQLIKAFNQLSKGEPSPISKQSLSKVFARQIVDRMYEQLCTVPAYVHTAKLLTQFKPEQVLEPYRELSKKGLVLRFFSLVSKKKKINKQQSVRLVGIFLQVLSADSSYSSKLMNFIFPEADALDLQLLADQLRNRLPNLTSFLVKRLKELFLLLPTPNLGLQIVEPSQIASLICLDSSFQADKPILLFDTSRDGRSLSSLASKMCGYPGRWLLVLHHSKGKLGSLQSGGFSQSPKAQGKGQSWIFSLQPQLKVANQNSGKGQNNCFFFFLNEKFKKGFGIGFNEGLRDFKLWVDDRGVSTSFQYNNTYGGIILNESEKLDMIRMCIWAFCSDSQLLEFEQNQQSQRRQLQRKRKINKSQILKDVGNGLLQNTFKHREQTQQ